MRACGGSNSFRANSKDRRGMRWVPDFSLKVPTNAVHACIIIICRWLWLPERLRRVKPSFVVSSTAYIINMVCATTDELRPWNVVPATCEKSISRTFQRLPVYRYGLSKQNRVKTKNQPIVWNKKSTEREHIGIFSDDRQAWKTINIRPLVKKKQPKPILLL